MITRFLRSWGTVPCTRRAAWPWRSPPIVARAVDWSRTRRTCRAYRAFAPGRAGVDGLLDSIESRTPILERAHDVLKVADGAAIDPGQDEFIARWPLTTSGPKPLSGIFTVAGHCQA